MLCQNLGVGRGDEANGNPRIGLNGPELVPSVWAPSYTIEAESCYRYQTSRQGRFPTQTAQHNGVLPLNKLERAGETCGDKVVGYDRHMLRESTSKRGPSFVLRAKKTNKKELKTRDNLSQREHLHV